MLRKALVLLILSTTTLAAQEAQEPQASHTTSDKKEDSPKVVRTLSEVMKTELNPPESPPSNSKKPLLSRMIILSDGQHYTIVPTGSILHLPEEYQKHIVAKPLGNFITWPKFLNHNKSWLIGQEVTLSMAKGDAEESQQTLKQLERSKKAVIALYKSCPITILEPVRLDETSSHPNEVEKY